MEISLDRLPIKRLESIEENGAERFPSDVDYDDKRVSLIRRIDFAWALEEEDELKKKKQKKSSKDSVEQWKWKGMVENLQLAHQELTVIIDLIDTVQANDAVTVAGMTRPKPMPNEILSDLAVSTATKLQGYRNLGNYFKQSAKALEQKINREARFYGALISGTGKSSDNACLLQMPAMRASPLIFLTVHYMIRLLVFAHLHCPLFV